MSVRREGMCVHWPDEEEEEEAGLKGREVRAETRLLGDSVSMVSSLSVVPGCLEGERVGGEKFLGWLRVETIMGGFIVGGLADGHGDIVLRLSRAKRWYAMRGGFDCRRLASMMRREFDGLCLFLDFFSVCFFLVVPYELAQAGSCYQIVGRSS